jgi:succinate dehydrogenase / fumarate reductase cytochrome b subunit
MICLFPRCIKSSIGKKQVVATTGLFLVLFVVGHLAGNLIMYLGPGAFNKYAAKLADLRPWLYIIEVGLLLIFIVHMWLTALLVIENRMARPVEYTVSKSVGKRALDTRIMPYTGTIIVAFVIWHLIDFTFVDKQGPLSVLADGQSYGLYGVVYNAFSDPTHSLLYIIAMAALGFHLSHGIQSFIQTFGFNHPKYTPTVRRASNIVAALIALTFSSIPVYVLVKNALAG